MRQLILFFFLVLSAYSFAQEKLVQDKITLNSGEVYVGKIVLQNTEIVMLVNTKGEKFQFQLAEVRKINTEIVTNNNIKDSADLHNANSTNFGGIIDFSAGISSSKNAFSLSPNTQLSLIFGSKNVLKQKLFLGFGIGYNTTYTKSQSIGFLPLFLRIQNTNSSKRTSPFFNMDFGYSVGLQPEYTGGMLAKISIGIARKVSNKSVFTGGFFLGTQFFSGNLKELNQYGEFSYFGKTAMNTFGLKVGLSF